MIGQPSEDEPACRAALQRYAANDPSLDYELDEITFLAAHGCAVPMACIILDAEETSIRSRFGVPDRLTPHVLSLSGDAALRERAADPPETGVAFYAAIPLITPDGIRIGSLCVLDQAPHDLTTAQRRSLEAAGRQVITLLELHRRAAADAVPESGLCALQSPVLDALTSHVCVLDQNGVIVSVNRSWERFADENGGSAAACGIGANYIDVCANARGADSAEAKLAEQGIRDVAEGRRAEFCLEYPCHSATEQRWFIAHVTLLDSDGPPHVVVAHENITQRKRAERAVAFQGRLLDTVAQAVIATDLEGVVTYWNRFAEGLYGWSAAEVTGRNLVSLLSPEPTGGTSPEDMWAVNGADYRSDEFVVARLNGSRFVALITNTPIFDDGGRAVGMIGSSCDTTERTQLEAALRETDEMFRQLANNITDVFWIVSKDTRTVHYVSPGYAQVWGRDVDGVYADPTQWADAIVPEDRDRVLAAFVSLRESARSVSVEYRIRRPDGEVRWIDERGFQVLDAAGDLIRVTGVSTDITERKRADEALRASEERFRTTLDNLMEGCQIIGHDWTYLYVNASVAHHGRRSVDELVGLTMTEVFPGIELTDMFAALRRCMVERVAEQIENEFLYADGTSAWLSLAVQPVPEGLFILSLDVSERKRSAEELRWKTAFLEAQVHSSPDGILVVDDRGKKILQNQRMVEMFQIPQHVVERDDHASDLTWASARVRNPEVFAARMAHLRDHPSEIALDEIDRIDGTVIERYSSPVLGKDGAYYGRTWTFRDITARKHAERENVRLASIVESTDDAVISLSIDGGVVTSWNAGAARLYGYSAAEIVGQPISLLIPPGQVDDELANLQRMRQGEAVAHYEARRMRKDGSFLHVSLTISPLRDPHGNVIGVSKIARDVTERHLAEEALKQAHDELESRVAERTRDLVAATEEADRASRAKSEFLSRMSHELRTPLNAILGFGQILSKQNLTDLQRESVQYVLKGGRHLLDLINEVLDIARVESGRIDMSIEPTAVAELISDACTLVQPLANGRSVQLIKDPSVVGGTHVLADRQRLKQVMINLLSNAIKYNRQAGTVQVSCTVLPSDRVRIAVRDTGNGIAAADLPKLFTPFERLAASSSDVEGTGLGLALSHSLVTAMGGSLDAESTAGVGSTFTVELPRAADVLDALDRTRIANSEQDAVRQRYGSRTVLSIEDNVSNVRLLEAILAARPGINLLAAMQGSVGLDLAEQHHPDLILLDVHLPDINGGDVLARLQLSDATRNIPVIVISADATSSQIERLLNAGAKAYLTKPLDIDEFLRILDDLLRPADQPSNVDAS